MRWHKRIRVERDGVNLAADIDAALAVNQADSGATTKVESVSHARVTQDSRRREAGSTHAEESHEQTHADRRAHEKEEPDDQ
jgi:hypothetical protein